MDTKTKLAVKVKIPLGNNKFKYVMQWIEVIEWNCKGFLGYRK